MHALIVHAHPEPTSFTATLMHGAAQALRERGAVVEVSDLYTMRFDPVSDRRNFRAAFDASRLRLQSEEAHASRHGGFVSELQAEIDKLARSDLPRRRRTPRGAGSAAGAAAGPDSPCSPSPLPRANLIDEPTMNPIPVPTRSQVSPENQALFDTLAQRIGFVPNLYAAFAHSSHALATYLTLQSAPSSLPLRAREVIHLAVSEAHGCRYCLAAHTAMARGAGFADAQILALRRGEAPFDAMLDALARLAQGLARQRGDLDRTLVRQFLAAGWTHEQLVDLVVLVGDKTISNLLHAVTQAPIDFPPAPPLDSAR